MSDEIRNQPEETRETGEVSENSEQRALDEATLESGTFIEKTGDFHQAEEIQEGLTNLVKNAEDLTVIPPPWVDGAFMPPEVTNYSVKPQPEAGTLAGSQPPIRSDLDGVTVTGSDTPDRDEAMPIPLPRQENLQSGVLEVEPDPTLSPEDKSLKGSLPGVHSDLDGLTVTGSDTPGGNETMPIPIPGPENIMSGVLGVDSEPTLSPEDKSLRGSLPGVRSDLDGVTVTGSDTPGGEEAMPIPLPGQRGSANQETKLEESTDTDSQTSHRVSVAMDDNPPPPPDLGNEQAPESIVTEDSEALLGTPPPDSGQETNDELDQDGEDGGNKNDAPEEAEKDWIPPEMYASIGKDGKVTVVDADGNPVNSPPIISKFVDENGVQKISATYPGDIIFDIPIYSGSLQGCYAHVGQDGIVEVVNADGKPVNSQPVITKIIDANGIAKYYASYPGISDSEKIELSMFAKKLQNCYAHIGQDGKITAVNMEGDPIDGQPQFTKVMTGNGVQKIIAFYPGSGTDLEYELPIYSGSLQNCYFFFGPDNKVTVVDKMGNPIKGQPLINKVMASNGIEIIIASYPGEETKVELAAYSISLKGAYIHPGQDGKMMVVDYYGKPVYCQPVITKIIDQKGMEKYIASYPGSDLKTEMPLFSASLQDCYAYSGQDGKIIVVDSDGKPLNSQPTITKIVDSKGIIQITAFYTGSQIGIKTNLDWYLPPSGYTKPEATRNV